MNCRTLHVLAALVFFSIRGVSGAQAPIPAPLREARTAFLINEVGNQDRFDDLAKELTKWKRLTLVDRAESADVTIALGGARTGTGAIVPVAGILIADEGRAFTLTIRDRNGDLLWNDRENIGSFSKSGTVKKLVKRLRERLEKPKPPR
jgi:hypothetical protein